MSTVFFHILQQRDKYIHVLLNTTVLNSCMFFLLFKICDAIPKDNRIKYSTISNASPLENVYNALHCNLIKMDIVLFSPMLKKWSLIIAKIQKFWII